MIRECYKLYIRIIFDAHMLNHEVGLDIDSIFEAPEPLSQEALHLVGPDATELKAFSIRQIHSSIEAGPNLGDCIAKITDVLWFT